MYTVVERVYDSVHLLEYMLKCVFVRVCAVVYCLSMCCCVYSVYMFKCVLLCTVCIMFGCMLLCIVYGKRR